MCETKNLYSTGTISALVALGNFALYKCP